MRGCFKINILMQPLTFAINRQIEITSIQTRMGCKILLVNIIKSSTKEVFAHCDKLHL